MFGFGFCHGDDFVRHCQLVPFTRGTGGFSSAGHNTHRTSCSVPFWKCVKPLASACHMTKAVSAVTLGRRSIFGSISWHHPHPLLTHRVASPAVFSPLIDMEGWKRGNYFRMALAVSGTESDTIRQAPWGLVLLPNLGFVGALWQFRPTHIWESTTCWDWSRKMGRPLS